MAAAPKNPYDALRFAGVGVTFGLELLVFAWIGQRLDVHFGTGPWLLVVALLMGLIVATTGLLRSLERWERDRKASRSTDDGKGTRGARD